MNTPETEHQARIKQIIDEGDLEYQAELQRQSDLMTQPTTITDILAKTPPVSDSDD
jgi:hypothetical protein